MAGLLMRGRLAARGSRAPDDVPWVVAGLLAIGVLLVVFGVMLDYSALDVWTGIIVFLVLVTVSVPLLQRIAQRDEDPWLFRTLFVALLSKFVASMARFFMIFVIYKGSGDAGVYHNAGVMFSNRLRDGVPIHPLDGMNGFPVETQRIADLVGALYTVTGPSVYAGFVVFAFLCFWGQVLMVRAFRVAVPEGSQRRYTVLVMFLPSLLFWPSSIGKEALIIFLLGVIMYGGGLLLAPRPQIRGAAYFIGGSLTALLIRPHVAAMSIGALALAMAVGVLAGTRGAALGRPGVTGSGRGRAFRVVAMVALVLLAVGASTRLGEVFGEDGEEVGAAAALEGAAQQTSRGGSEFAPVGVSGPSEVPAGIVSVYFRPFPWEARNFSGLLAAAETLLLIGLFAVSWRRVIAFPKLVLGRPYLLFAAAFVVAFAVGFSFIGNFGILARQRVQALPALLVLLALPPVSATLFGGRRGNRTASDAGESRQPVGSLSKVKSSTEESRTSFDGDMSRTP